MDWFMPLIGNFWFWVVGVPVLVCGIYAMTDLLIRHRERMAMIERGMNPDLRDSAPERTAPVSYDPLRAEIF